MMFGLMLGVLLAFFCDGVLAKPIERHITQLMNGEYQVKGYSKLFRNLTIASFGYVLLIITIYIVFGQSIPEKKP